MTAAVFGLIGVVVGGVLNGVVSTWIEHRKQSADARSAARLVQTELEFFHAAANAVQDHSPAELPGLRHTDNPIWRDNRAVLSRTLPDADWEAIHRAYADIEAFMSLLAFEQDGSIAGWRVNEARRVGWEMKATLTKAIRALARDETVEPDYRELPA